jgi:hypothetical protein
MTNPNETRPAPESERFAGHTPGPWSAYDDNEGESPPRPLWSVTDRSFHEGGDDSQPLQAVLYYGCKADAELIAAAPDLLAALADRDAQIAALTEALRDARRFIRHDHEAGASPGSCIYAPRTASLIDAALSRAPSVAGAEVEK